MAEEHQRELDVTALNAMPLTGIENELRIQDSSNMILSPYSDPFHMILLMLMKPDTETKNDLSNMQQQSSSRNTLFSIPLKMMNNTSDFEPTPLPPNHQHQNVVTSGAPHSCHQG
eukprot:15333920-Ditylum_brightwellii.AAC.1